MASMEDFARAICQSHNLDLSELLGEGSFKETYRVVSDDGRSDALKLFKPGNSAERSRREIDAMQRCEHQSVARIHQVGEYQTDDGPLLYVLEEYLGGGTLAERLGRVGNLTIPEAYDLGSALISAISHIAALDLVHRDIKPDNIIFRDDGNTPVIVDFGLVRDLASGSLTATWFSQGPGTPLFAAPEQLNNRKHLIDWRSDQFALGVVLSFALWGVHPYAQPGDKLMDIVNRVASLVGPSESFLNEVDVSSLTSLRAMVAAWPVDRHRRPRDLEDNWHAQKVR